MSDYKQMVKILKKLPAQEEGETFYTICEDYIILHTDDSYCNATIYFDDKGNIKSFY